MGPPPLASSSATAGPSGGHTRPTPPPLSVPSSSTNPTMPQPSASSTSLSAASAASAQSHTTSVMTEDEEDLEDYRPGGYHPINIGDEFNQGRYVVVRKLGWGHFSTVWLARDNTTRRHVALKVVKSDGHYTETALDEIQLLQRVVNSSPTHAGRCHVVGLVDDFRHNGPNGSHVCMVFEVLGENLLGLIKRYQHRGVPQHIVKQIAKQVLLGLDYLHNECRIIHTDLKPENVLICIEDVESVVQAELATCPAAVPTKLVGVPPSQGRSGNQTPRHDSMFILGSQPLPSPSSSYSSSPMLDKYGFGMSKISGGGLSKPSSTTNVFGAAGGGGTNGSESTGQPRSSTAEGIGNDLDNVTLESGADPFTWEKTKAPPAQPAGPSLLSQQMVKPPGPSESSPSKAGALTGNGTAGASSQTVYLTPATTPDSAIADPVKGKPAPPAPVLSSVAAGKLPERSETAATDLTTESASSTHLNNLQDTSAHHGPIQPPHPPSTSSEPTPTDARPQSSSSNTHPVPSRENSDEPHIAPVAGDPNMLPPPFPYDPVSLERITVKIADLGNACWVDHHFTNDIQTRQYRCPEIILGTKWGSSVDVWSAACLFFELLTGDYLFDPQPGGKYDKDDDHMAQVLELLGEMPKSLALSGKYSHEIFNRKGELRHISRLRMWPLISVLKEKYLMEQEEAQLLSSFLLPMLHFYPDSRASPGEMVKHPWLDGVVVQGEVEMAEIAHQRRQEILAANAARDSGDSTPRSPSMDQKSVSASTSETRFGSGLDDGSSTAVTENGNGDPRVGEKDGKEKKSALDEVKKLGPAVKGLVGMGRI